MIEQSIGQKTTEDSNNQDDDESVEDEDIATFNHQSSASIYKTVEDLPSLVAGVTETPRGIRTSGREDRRRRRRQRRRKKSNHFNLGRWFYRDTTSHIRFIGGEVVPAFSMGYKLGKDVCPYLTLSIIYRG